MRLLEIFNTKQTINWIRERSNQWFSEFEINNRLFFIQLNTFVKYNKIILNVVFGVYDDNVASTKAANNEFPFKTLSVVKNAIIDFVKHHNVEIVVFSAKDGDDHFLSRSSLYAALAENTAKHIGWYYLRLSGKNVETFVMSKNKLDIMTISKLKIEAIKDRLK